MLRIYYNRLNRIGEKSSSFRIDSLDTPQEYRRARSRLHLIIGLLEVEGIFFQIRAFTDHRASNSMFL